MEIKNNEKIIEKTRKVKVFREFARIYFVRNDEHVERKAKAVRDFVNVVLRRVVMK